VEHPYGTIKRQWGFCHVLTKKGKQRASADVGLMFTAYNFKRIINIVGKTALLQYLAVLASLFSMINAFTKRFISKIRSLKLMSGFALPFSLLLSYRFKIAYIY
jgi:hypothetical protein